MKGVKSCAVGRGTGQLKKHGLAFSAEMMILGKKWRGKSLGNGLGKSMWKKVGRWKLRCNRRLTFSLCGKNGEWDTASGVGTNVGEKLVGKISKISGFFSEKNVSEMGWKRRGGLS